MLDEVDSFIIRETNNLDKITVAILAAALISNKKDVKPEEAIEIYGSLFTKMREKKLVSFP